MPLWLSRFLWMTAQAAAIATFSGVASADWQYTRWGMRPDDVIKFSNGVAEQYRDSNIDLANETVRARGGYVGNDFRFTSFFYFDNLSGKLSKIRLEALDLIKCSNILDSMKIKYGEVVSHKSYGDSSSFMWHDMTRRNKVEYYTYKQSCGIMYQPLDLAAYGDL